MDNKFTIRLITSLDHTDTLEVYKPYVSSTAITFDYDIPTPEEFKSKIEIITINYPWLVCLKGDKIIGYAYGSTHRQKTAYQWSAESTIYLSPDFHRKGIARVLYQTLFSILKLQGFINVYAGVTVPNIKSEAFHKALGFYEIGIFKNIGFKLGKWHHVKWFQYHLTDHLDNPSLPKTIKDIETTPSFQTILKTANTQLETIIN